MNNLDLYEPTENVLENLYDANILHPGRQLISLDGPNVIQLCFNFAPNLHSN